MLTSLTSTALFLEEKYNWQQSLQLILMDAGYDVKTLQNSADVMDILANVGNGLVILGVQNSDQILLVPTFFNNAVEIPQRQPQFGNSINGSSKTLQEHPHYGGSLNEY